MASFKYDGASSKDERTDRELGVARECDNDECEAWDRTGMNGPTRDGLCAECFVTKAIDALSEGASKLDNDSPQWSHADEMCSLLEDERKAIVAMLAKRWDERQRAAKKVVAALVQR